MDTLKRSTVYDAIDVLDYFPGKVEKVRIMSKTTGSVTLVAVDAGVDAENAVSPFDTLLYLLDGSAEVTIDHKAYHLTSGQCIIVPGHVGRNVVSDKKFKMLLIVIKSGYE